MLTYEQIQAIAAILGWTCDEVISAIGELNAGFMLIDVEYIDDTEILADLETDECGFYSRLSAPGYLDCTNWFGPFQTEVEAVADILSNYAN
jgi:hypothetical protein